MDYLINLVGLRNVDNILGYIGQFNDNTKCEYDTDLNIIFTSKILYKKYFPFPDDIAENRYTVCCDIIKFNGDIEKNIEKCSIVTQRWVNIYKILSTASKSVKESDGFLN
jgi:hypothetical protein